MALGTSLPFGLRNVGLKPINAAGAVGSLVTLPYGRTFKFSETESFADLRANDTVIAAHGDGPIVAWSLEAGGISIPAYLVIAGGAAVTTGTTPNQIQTFTKKTTDARPYFQAEGQAISDSGGDLHCVVYRCKADGALDGEFAQGAFWLQGASGRGFGDTATGNLYQWVQNETAAAIV